VTLDNDEIAFFVSDSTDLELGADDISVRLKASTRIQTRGKVAEQLSVNIQNGNISPALSSIVYSKSYDSYTDSDGIIHTYASNFFGNYYLNGLITDDPIVRIIPKELCFVLGEHFYMGKQYGFFIKVINSSVGSTANFDVDVFVFDIFHRLASFPNNPTGSSKITPLFQFKYRAIDRNIVGGWSGFNPDLTKIVYPHTHYDAVEYFLNDIGFKHSLSNPTRLNPGDPGYIAEEDDGAFIIQTRYNQAGVGLKSKDGSFLNDILSYGFGFIPYVGDMLSAAEYINNVYDGFGNRGYYYSRETIAENNEANIETFGTNNTDQLTGGRTNLIKSVSVRSIPNSDSPRILHVGGGYAESKYVLARRSNSAYGIMNVATSVSANILEDNTSKFWFFGWRETGSINILGRVTGTYETSPREHAGDISSDILNYGYVSKTVKADSVGKIYRLAPTVSGSYLIYSLGSLPPAVTVHNATLNQSTVVSILNPINLIAGNVYYIETDQTYNSNFEYSVRIGYNPIATKALSLNADTAVSISTANFKMFSFTPSQSNDYDIFTSRTSGDPYLILFNSSGTMLAYNDDGKGNLDAIVSCYLTGGTTYYIAVQGYHGNAATLNLIANVGCQKIYLNSSVQVPIMGYPFYERYEFTAPYSGSYIIYTDGRSFGNPALALSDANGNELAYDDNGAGNANNAAIVISLTAGRKYYICATCADMNPALYQLIVIRQT
jgi:hypothetical protein